MKKILIFIILVVGAYFAYDHFFKDKEVEPEKFIYEDILTKVGENTTNVNSFTIYGKYLNFKGDLPKEEGSFDLVFKNNDEEIVVKSLNDSFVTNEYINEGINLEKLKQGSYIMLLHNKTSDKYYNLINKTEYHDNKYYTITKNSKNNLITFKEETFNTSNYWTINIKEEKLPEDVYDFVIDPGHGGVDTGAGNGRYNESTFTLDYAKSLKASLEEEGFKVKLTREEDKQIDHYGEGSRTGIAYETKAKLYLSLHLNSSGTKYQKGVEIYRAYGGNNDYAKLLADNIVKEADTKYSNNPENKKIDGVYMRVYSAENIKALTKEAKSLGFEPYDFTDHETYYYFIRETGGIITHAFTDGRNPKYKANPYRNSNQGTEAYLCELAYISHSDDLKNIINNKDGYIKALTKSVITYADIPETNQNN